MLYVFTHAEYADMVFIYGFCNGSALSACTEYSIRFPNRRVQDSRVFACVHNNLCGTGALPSSHTSCERANKMWIKLESILHLVERSQTTSIRRISTRMANCTSARPVYFSFVCCPPKARTARRPQQSYTYCCQGR
jgi:hypothetical protein